MRAASADSVKAQCSAVFCMGCIREWSLLSDRCPMCSVQHGAYTGVAGEEHFLVERRGNNYRLVLEGGDAAPSDGESDDENEQSDDDDGSSEGSVGDGGNDGEQNIGCAQCFAPLNIDAPRCVFTHCQLCDRTLCGWCAGPFDDEPHNPALWEDMDEPPSTSVCISCALQDLQDPVALAPLTPLDHEAVGLLRYTCEGLDFRGVAFYATVLAIIENATRGNDAVSVRARGVLFMPLTRVHGRRARDPAQRRLVSFTSALGYSCATRRREYRRVSGWASTDALFVTRKHKRAFCSALKAAAPRCVKLASDVLARTGAHAAAAAVLDPEWSRFALFRINRPDDVDNPM